MFHMFQGPERPFSGHKLAANQVLKKSNVVPSGVELVYGEMCYVTLAVRCLKRMFLRNKNAIQQSTMLKEQQDEGVIASYTRNLKFHAAIYQESSKRIHLYWHEHDMMNL